MRQRLPLAVSIIALGVAVIGPGTIVNAATAALPANSVGTAQLRTGAVTQPKISATAQAVLLHARAYAWVDGFTGALVRMHNVSAVTNPSPGVWCLALGSPVDASSAMAVVSDDWSLSPDSGMSFAWWRSAHPNCLETNQLEIDTGYMQSNGIGTPDAQVLANEGFTMMVP
jgi:hypothetical protein